MRYFAAKSKEKAHFWPEMAVRSERYPKKTAYF
jgi:hypothetical protein